MKKYILLLLSTFSIISLNAQCVDNGNYWNESWVSCTTSANPNQAYGNTFWILYEFDEYQYIDATHFWNANRVGESGWGAKDVLIDYSTDGSTWTHLGAYTFPQADESTTYTGFEGPQFNGVFINKILITILSTHDGGACASLAEVQFQIDETACYGIVDACGICNGLGEPTWFIDADGDGLGNNETTIEDCNQPIGYVDNNLDACDNGALGWFEIGPLFSDHGCTNCHGGDDPQNDLDLTTYATTAMGGFYCNTNILTGTTLVEIISNGYYSCSNGDTFGPMNNKPGVTPFDSAELAKLQQWIDGGANESCTDFCIDNKTIATTFTTGTIDYHLVGNQITAHNLIESGANIIYDAGNQISLEPEFEVELGAEFLGFIQGCPVNATTSSYGIGNATINIYPNPEFDRINIDVYGQLDFKVNLYGFDGELIKSISNSNVIKVDSMPTGTYLLEIIDLKTGEKIVERIVLGK